MADHGIRILLVTFPAQGHINPSLQFAKRLLGMGVNVTLSTSISAIRHMTPTPPQGLTFSPFSDGHDDGYNPSVNIPQFLSDLTDRGSQAVAQLITAAANDGRPFTQLVYTTVNPWVAQVGHRLHIPCTLLWIQPAAIFDIYYNYFNGFGDVIRQNGNDPSSTIKLPGLPLFTSRDLPSFLLPSTPNVYNSVLLAFKEHLEVLEEETNPKILVNTFDALELDFLRAVDHKYKMIGIGPLIPSAFLDGKDPSDTSFGGDLFQKSKDYMEWLDSKPESSVVYASFGSISDLAEQQMEEIARGLLESHRPFLWVIRAGKNEERQEDRLSCKEELEREGLIVSWCSQVEVLSHACLGCFVTHCGWNSSLESLVSGVPVVALPQWSDQATNAKLIEDVWKTGVRVMQNEEGIVEGNEIKRCLDMVMGGGERGEEVRKNAKKWKDLAREAVKEGGSSNMNLKAFVDEVGDDRFKM